jgi:4-amino-4-deoxy-L-arabinose transferase-like glycosyltransferase
MDTARRWRSLVVVVAVGAVARVLYAFLVIPDYVPDSDASQYMDLARNINAGRGFSMTFPWLDIHPTAFRPPGYPYLLAIVTRGFGDSVAAGQALNLVLGLLVIALTWFVARRLAGPKAALAAGLAVALYPPLIANDVVLLTEPLSLALLLGSILALLDHRWIPAGALMGLLVLTRPSAQFLVLLFAAWALWQIGWRRALGLVGVTAFVVSPWIVRNAIVMDSPAYVTSNGFNLAAMYSPQAQDADWFVDPVTNPAFDEYRFLQANEIVWSEEMQRLGIEGIRDNPGYVLRVLQRNVLAYFELTPSDNEIAEELDGRNLDFRGTTLPLFYVVTAVGWFGLVVRRRNPGVLLLMGVALYFMVSSLLLVSPPRLRAPFDLICCIGVGLAYAWWDDRRSAARTGAVPATTNPDEPELTVPGSP